MNKVTANELINILEVGATYDFSLDMKLGTFGMIAEFEGYFDEYNTLGFSDAQCIQLDDITSIALDNCGLTIVLKGKGETIYFHKC